jgi:hypothetical protein
VIVQLLLLAKVLLQTESLLLGGVELILSILMSMMF